MNQLGVFAKFWAPGQVKTRLARDLGPSAAAEIYRASLETTLMRLLGSTDCGVLCYSPQENHAEFEALAGEWWHCQPQVEGDLGARMATFFDEAFAAGMERVVLIGSDSPTLPLAYLHAAFAALQTHDAVLGKAADGGYYLIGLVRPCPDLFTEVAWSTPEVWQQTTSRLDQLGASWQALDTWSDFDDLASLHALRMELASMQPLPGVYASLARAIERAFAAAPTLGRNTDEA